MRLSVWCSRRYNNWYFSPSAQLYYLIKVVLMVSCTNYYRDNCSVMPNIKILWDVLKLTICAN